MKKTIAIPTSNKVLDEHFGHCKNFTLFQIENNEVISSTELDAPPHEPGKLPLWLAEKGVTDVIAGGMGQHAISIFNNQNINVFVGASEKEPLELVKGFLNNSLSLKANYCNH